MENDADVLIIGAGIAGLAAAYEVSRAGINVIVLEARERIGGRIYTLHDESSPLPIELGAEFIHGRPPETLAITELAHLSTPQVLNRHWYLRNGILDRSDDFLSMLENVMEHMKHKKGGDQSFRQFLDEYGQTDQSSEARIIATLYVEGFHAARTERISVTGLNEVNEAARHIDDEKQFRILNGYDLVAEWLHVQAVAHGASFRLNTNVEEVQRQPNHLTVITRSESGTQEYNASQAVVTLPLPVLQAGPKNLGAVRFVPALTEKESAANKLAMGQVVRIILRFRERFWEGLRLPIKGGAADNLEDLAFIHAPNELIPTWWTQLPVRVPLLVGWVGGPGVERLSFDTGRSLLDKSVHALSNIFAIPRREIEELFEESYSHDWQRDPFSQGAYSYVPVGGLGAESELAKPVANTLFFAGEATNAEGHSGTVHGAIATGFRAAREIINAR